MNTSIEVEAELSSLEDFLNHRSAMRYANEEIEIERFGFGLYERRGFIYPEQRDSWWDEYPYRLVSLDEYRIMTEQQMVFANTVEHYLMTPLLASEFGYTRRDGIVPHALVSESTKTIYLAEGNHRCAASKISHRPLLMKLAPLSKVRMDPSSSDFMLR